MTLENLLSQVGMGTKQLTERHSGEYGAPVHDQNIYYAYEPSSHSYGHGSVSKHSHGGSGLKSNASMSALTLLAFLFFLHILQQCIKEHMTEMSTAPVVVMSASRESDDILAKTGKIDKSSAQFNYDESNREKEDDQEIPSINNVEPDNMMRINAPVNKPKIFINEYESKYDGDKSSFPGFVNAMNDN